MKKIYLFILLLVIGINVQGQGVKFPADKVPTGNKINFTYNPKGTKLQGLTPIKCIAYVFHSTTYPQAAKIELIKEGDIYKGEIDTRDSATLVGLAFSVGEQKDEARNGYLLDLTHAGKVTAETFLNKAFLFEKNGVSYFGLTASSAKAAEYYKQAFELRPALKKDYNHNYNYLNLTYKGNSVSGTALINQEIAQLSKISSPTEEDLNLQLKLYTLINQKQKSDAVKTVLLNKYPLGNFAFIMEKNAIPRNLEVPETEEKYNSLIAKFKLDPAKKTDEQKLNNIYVYLAFLYSKTRDAKKFEFYASKMRTKVLSASLYNGFASFWAEKKDNIVDAAEISKKSLVLVEQAKLEGLAITYATQEEYNKSLDQTYGTYAGTYASLLYQLGKYQDAVTVQEKAMQLAPSLDGRIYYVNYLAKNGQKEEAFAAAEKIIREGNATSALRTAFKDLYSSLKKEGSYESYMLTVDRASNEKEREEWIKKRINIPAPLFSLVNLKGETVSLASFKGKTVIIDYWATWCVPCIASFPGMQKAADKYKNDPNIVFLFINTSQREENRTKIVTDFMTKNPYPFNVLLDKRDQRDVDKFEVRDLYNVTGIPAKFVIDPKGNIRFKIVGSSDSDEEIVKEVDMMLSLLDK